MLLHQFFDFADALGWCIFNVSAFYVGIPEKKQPTTQLDLSQGLGVRQPFSLTNR